MRRRIDTHDLSDVTKRPYLYVDEFDGKVYLQPPPKALYDAALWTELNEARRRLREVEARVVTALITEPLDVIEVELGCKQGRMSSDAEPYDSEEWYRIEARLIEHAQTVERKP